MGVVCNPYLDEIFYAIKGNGAYLRKGKRDTKLSVKDAPLSASLILVGTDPYHKSKTAPLTASLISRALQEGIDIRRLGAAALDLAYIAAGRANLFVELFLSPWDYAAGALLITEAGGTIASLGGSALHYIPSSVVAGAPAAYASFMNRVVPKLTGIGDFLNEFEHK